MAGIFDIAVEDAYDRIKGERKSITGSWEMARCLRVASMLGLADRIIVESAQWPNTHGKVYGAFGRPAHLEYLPWFMYVRAMIDAGYYGIAEVDHGCSGGIETDHWVMICGARTEGAVSGKTLTGDVLVSCSARSSGMRDEWVEACDFLTKRGGYNILFARPAGTR